MLGSSVKVSFLNPILKYEKNVLHSAAAADSVRQRWEVQCPGRRRSLN